MKDARVPLGDVFFRFLEFLATSATMGQEWNAFRSDIDGRPKILPCPEASRAGGSGHLPRDLQHISQSKDPLFRYRQT
ncbi:hypothetical protein [Tunturiibacter lichenicola]|uniref:hypothetical protein n=1 Tax=Tunturiibacter lichenicola TaxID=2051959 RepID=UPI0021B32398|nr:hypothetical protein [Edaphobacter lichenicola]